MGCLFIKGEMAANGSSNGNGSVAARKKPSFEVSRETREALKSTAFDVWKHHDSEELVELLLAMYEELGLLEELRIPREVLKKFLITVESRYPSNPFHNFRHCFCVAQMMFAVLCGCPKLTSSDGGGALSKMDQAVLITAAVCHDLDHPGNSNSYELNAKTDLAAKFPTSPLENLHLEVALEILSKPESDIFRNVDMNRRDSIRQDISNLILATDMSHHNDIFSDFESKIDAGFDFGSPDHVRVLKSILIKACDVSNECRPPRVSEVWVDRLLQEYFAQSDKEKRQGLPVQKHMDRDHVTKPGAQIGFITYILLPMFEVLAKVLPEIQAMAVAPLQKSLKHYQDMADNNKPNLQENADGDPANGKC